jgi:uncharacterized protein YbjQ (UPF0145 family)
VEDYTGLIQIGLSLGILVIGYGFGRAVERRHFKRLERLEKASRNFPVITLRDAPASVKVVDCGLVHAGVVVSIDYFKRFLAALRNIFGGRVTAYETVLDRGRREALIRLKKRARDAGCHAVINVRLETARLASSRRDGKGTAGIEVFAFGTAVKIEQ